MDHLIIGVQINNVLRGKTFMKVLIISSNGFEEFQLAYFINLDLCVLHS